MIYSMHFSPLRSSFFLYCSVCYHGERRKWFFGNSQLSGPVLTVFLEIYQMVRRFTIKTPPVDSTKSRRRKLCLLYVLSSLAVGSYLANLYLAEGFIFRDESFRPLEKIELKNKIFFIKPVPSSLAAVFTSWPTSNCCCWNMSSATRTWSSSPSSSSCWSRRWEGAWWRSSGTSGRQERRQKAASSEENIFKIIPNFKDKW